MVPGKGKAFLEKESAWAEVCRRRNYEASLREHKDHKGEERKNVYSTLLGSVLEACELN